MNDPKGIPEDIKLILKNVTIYDKLQEIDKTIDEKLFKTRLEIQENLIIPSNRVKGLLRTHIYSYIQKEFVEEEVEVEIQNEISNENSNENNININNFDYINENANENVNDNNNKDNDKMDLDIEIQNENEKNLEKEKYIDINNNNTNISNNNNKKTTKQIQIQIKEKLFWVIRIQGKLQNIFQGQSRGFFRKFSYFFNKINLKFQYQQSQTQSQDRYQDIEWTRIPNSDVDSFEIKRPIEDFQKLSNEFLNLKIQFHLNYLHQEYKISDELKKLLGISQETRPRILNYLWQYIKINSLQDKETPNFINLNRELQKIFRCEKLDISTLTVKLSEFLRPIEPSVINFTIKNNFNWEENQQLYDFFINVDDPHFLDISNFLSNIENESILFPKSLFYLKNESHSGPNNNNIYCNSKNDKINCENFYSKINDYDRNIQDLIEKLRKLKYKYDFYEAFSKDPKKFIDNFLQQQNSLLKIMKEESSVMDARWDYYSAQYYKDYEVILNFVFIL